MTRSPIPSNPTALYKCTTRTTACVLISPSTHSAAHNQCPPVNSRHPIGNSVVRIPCVGLPHHRNINQATCNTSCNTCANKPCKASTFNAGCCGLSHEWGRSFPCLMFTRKPGAGGHPGSSSSCLQGGGPRLLAITWPRHHWVSSKPRARVFLVSFF